MSEKDPYSYSVVTYLFILFISMWGGVVNFIRKREQEVVKPFSIIELIGELTTSAFSGILVFFLCEASGISHLMSAALVGIAGHMGSRLIYQLELYLQSRFFPIQHTEEVDTNGHEQNSTGVSEADRSKSI